jgi:hypothetical protein
MAEASDREREAISKKMKELRQFAPPVKEEDKPSVKDYKSEDKNEMAKTKIEYTEVTPKEEKHKQ